jgi:hypothetical protein
MKNACYEQQREHVIEHSSELLLLNIQNRNVARYIITEQSLI